MSEDIWYKNVDDPKWIRDCMKWRGMVLTGKYRHWCWDWDGLPMDETCLEFPCECYRKELEGKNG